MGCFFELFLNFGFALCSGFLFCFFLGFAAFFALDVFEALTFFHLGLKITGSLQNWLSTGAGIADDVLLCDLLFDGWSFVVFS